MSDHTAVQDAGPEKGGSLHARALRCCAAVRRWPRRHLPAARPDFIADAAAIARYMSYFTQR